MTPAFVGSLGANAASALARRKFQHPLPSLLSLRIDRRLQSTTREAGIILDPICSSMLSEKEYGYVVNAATADFGGKKPWD